MPRPNPAQPALGDAHSAHGPSWEDRKLPRLQIELGTANQPQSVSLQKRSHGILLKEIPQGAAKWQQEEHTLQKTHSYGHQAPEHYFCMLLDDKMILQFSTGSETKVIKGKQNK